MRRHARRDRRTAHLAAARGSNCVDTNGYEWTARQKLAVASMVGACLASENDTVLGLEVDNAVASRDCDNDFSDLRSVFGVDQLNGQVVWFRGNRR